MAKQHVSPNRMELMRLKRELNTARRGHRMLKDKRDGLMKQFLSQVYDAQKLRMKVDRLLSRAAGDMQIARAVMQPEVLGEALMGGQGNLEVAVTAQNVMAVMVPHFALPEGLFSGAQNGLPYGPASTSGEMDYAVQSLRKAFPFMLELAEKEKMIQLLADEIEKTRRRVNSLEHVMIPNLQETIKEITMKMDENERGNLTRLMKVKDMLVAQEIQRRRLADARAALARTENPGA